MSAPGRTPATAPPAPPRIDWPHGAPGAWPQLLLLGLALVLVGIGGWLLIQNPMAQQPLNQVRQQLHATQQLQNHFVELRKQLLNLEQAQLEAIGDALYRQTIRCFTAIDQPADSVAAWAQLVAGSKENQSDWSQTLNRFYTSSQRYLQLIYQVATQDTVQTLVFKKAAFRPETPPPTLEAARLATYESLIQLDSLVAAAHSQLARQASSPPKGDPIRWAYLVLGLATLLVVLLLILPARQHRQAVARLMRLLTRLRVAARLDNTAATSVSLDRGQLAFQKAIEVIEEDLSSLQNHLAALSLGQPLKVSLGLNQRRPEFDGLLGQLSHRLQAAGDTLIEWRALLECVDALQLPPEASTADLGHAWCRALLGYLNATEALFITRQGSGPRVSMELVARAGDVFFRSDLCQHPQAKAWIENQLRRTDFHHEAASSLAAPLFVSSAIQLKELNVIAWPLETQPDRVSLLLLLIPDSHLERYRTSNRMLLQLMRAQVALRTSASQLDELLPRLQASERRLTEEQDRACRLEHNVTRLTKLVDELQGQQALIEGFWNAAMPALVLDADHVIVSANELACRLLGSRSELLYGRPLAELAELSAGLNWPAAGSPIDRWSGEVYWKKSESERLLIGLHWVPEPAAAGRPPSYRVFLTDRSDVEYLAGELRLLMEKLSDKEQEAYNLQLLLESAQSNVSHLRNALDNLTQALNDSAIVAETDTLGRIISVNEQFLQSCRYSREEIIGQNHRILKSGHQPDDLYEQLWRTITSGQTWKGELKNRRKNGSYYWISTTITPIREEDGQFKRFIAVSFDITRRKLQEDQLMAAIELSHTQEQEMMQNVEDLRELQAMLRQTQLDLRGRTEAIRNAALVSETDLRGNIQHANEAFLQAAGYGMADLANKNHRILKSGVHEAAFYHRMWKTISSGEVWRDLICNKSADGRLYWVNLCITPVLNFDNQPIKYIGIGFEVTHLVKLETELGQLRDEQTRLLEQLDKQERKLLAATYELTGRTQALQAAAVVAEIDPNGTITHANDRLLILARESYDDLCGKPFAHYFHSPELNLEEPAFWQQLAEQGRWTGELILTVYESTPLWVLVHLHAVPGELGQLRYYLCLINDITLLKKQEAELARLQMAVNQLRQELEAERQHQPELPDVFPAALFRRSLSDTQPFIWVGAHIHALTGRDAAQWLSPACPWPALLHPDDRSHVLLALEAARLERRGYLVTFRWLDARGQWRFIREEGKPGYDDQGRLTHFDGLWIDISREIQALNELRQQLEATERQAHDRIRASEELEKELQLLEARARALQLAALVIETDTAGRVLQINDEAQTRLGRSRTELTNQLPASWLAPEHSPAFVADLIRQAASGSIWRGQLKLQSRSHGGGFWCRAVVAAIQPLRGEGVRLLWMLHDSQRELEQERALRQLYQISQEREREFGTAALEMEKIQQLILENQLLLSSRVEALNHSALVSETDTQGRITYVNDQALRVWGYSREEALGRRHNLISSDHHSRSFFAQLWSTITAGHVWRGQILNRNKQGDYFWVQLTITPVLDGQAVPTRYIGVAFDVTERVRQSTKASRLPEASRSGTLGARMHQVLRHIGGADPEAPRPAFDQLPFPAAELDERWRFRRANAAFQERLGWQAAELAGESIVLILQAEQSSGASLDQLTQVLTEHRFAYAELQYIDRQRAGKRFATAFALQQQPEGPAIWMLLFDLEKQLQVGSRSESGPSISERMIERLTAHTLYFEMDLDGNFAFVHERMLALLGRSSDQVLGKPFPVISSRRTPVALFEGLIHTLNEGKTWYGSLEWVDARGVLIRVIGAVAPILGAGRVVERIVGLFVEYDRFDIRALELDESETQAPAQLQTERRPAKERDQA